MNVNKSQSITRETESALNFSKSVPELQDFTKDPNLVDGFKDAISKDLKLTLPKDGKITPDYLKNLLKESDMYQNTFTDSQYEMLVPYAQKAYESLK